MQIRKIRTVQAMCKAGLFAPSISIKLVCIIINILESSDDEALNQLYKDIQQKDYRNVQNEAMARRMKEIKEGKEFIEMCEVLESYGNESVDRQNIYS